MIVRSDALCFFFVRFLSVLTQVWVFVQSSSEGSSDWGSITCNGLLLFPSAHAHADCFEPS